MLKDQAKLIHKLKSIQIDLTFKRVKGNINEFEINSYNSEHKLSKFFVFTFNNLYILQKSYLLFYIQSFPMHMFILMLLQQKDNNNFLLIYLM